MSGETPELRGGHARQRQDVSAGKHAPFGYRTLFESAAAGMLLASAEGGYVIEANPEACDVLGRTEEQVLSEKLRRLFDASDPRFEAALEERRTVGSFRGRLRMLHEDGSSFAVEASMAGYGEEGEERVAVVFKEPAGREAVLEKALSELEEGRRRLAASERLFRTTFDEAAIGMAHVSAEGRWLRVNDKLCSILGYRRDELLSLAFQDLTHPDDLGKDRGYVEKMLAGEIGSYRIEKRYLKKDRSVVWADLSVSMIRLPSGEPECFVAAVEDITALKLKELVSDPLTERELEVLSLVAEGKTNPEIAKSVSYSLSMVKLRMQRILAKLGVPDRAKAVDRAIDIGLLPPLSQD